MGFLKQFSPRKYLRRGPGTARDASPSAALACGLRDLSLAGWFNSKTGELFTGYRLGPRDTHLDVGCGKGGMTMFAARQGCKVIATDVSQEAVTTVEQQLREADVQGFRCMVSDSDPLPLPGEVATRITCSEVMEHVPDPARFLSELVRVGAPGALYLLTVPDPASEAVQKHLAPPSYWREPNHVRIFGREEFADVVTGSGLEIVARHFVGFYASVWWALFWSAGQELGEAEQPILAAWTDAWMRVLKHPDGVRIKHALDESLPKSQIILARKAA